MGAYIGLMDCNNFFVSCERLFRPDLWNKPVAVLSSNDGCIVARSNEVKAMGIPMGIPLFKARQLADMSQVHLFSSNFTLYRDISDRVMRTLRAEVGDCEVYSVDEAFFPVPFDVTEGDVHILRQKIMQTVGVPVSIGIGQTKTLAKVASELEKKGSGVCWLSPEKWQQLAPTYPCGEVWNLGRQTAAKLQGDGVTTAAQFMTLERGYVQKRFGVQGRRIQDELLGLKVHELGGGAEDVPKSLTSSRSFATACSLLPELESALSYHVMQVATKLRAQQLRAGKLYVSVRASRYSDWSFRGIQGELCLPEATNDTGVLTRSALTVLRQQFDPRVPYKKAGVTLSAIVPTTYTQPTLFAVMAPATSASTVLDTVTDSVNIRFGKGALRLGTVLNSGPRTSRRSCSPAYTTSWGDIPRVAAK